MEQWHSARVHETWNSSGVSVLSLEFLKDITMRNIYPQSGGGADIKWNSRMHTSKQNTTYWEVVRILRVGIGLGNKKWPSTLSNDFLGDFFSFSGEDIMPCCLQNTAHGKNKHE